MPTGRRKRVPVSRHSVNKSTFKHASPHKRKSLDAAVSSRHKDMLRDGRVLSSISYLKLTQQEFWASYVSKRQPIVLSGSCAETDLAQLRNWTLTHLRAKAGKADVQVERRNVVADSFGKGKKETMPFSDFLDQLESQNQLLYLTTQQADKVEKESSQIAEVDAPLSFLKGELPIRPWLMGNLIPQSTNLWLGSSTNGTPSGLHHDYHDNLYILLKGTKQFQLWSPTEAHNMYTHGAIAKVHKNGRIVYQEEGLVRADGSRPEESGAVDKSQQAANDRVSHLACKEASCSGADDSDAELEAILNQEVARSKKSKRTDDWDARDDFQPSDSEGNRSGSVEHTDAASEPVEPLSFSQIDPAKLLRRQYAAKFPLFPGTAASVSCTLNAGEMLYLPAGWFHNVKSLNAQEGRGNCTDSYHLAVNYWFHPPDNLDSSAKGFSKPYLRSFWIDRWKRYLESERRNKSR